MTVKTPRCDVCRYGTYRCATYGGDLVRKNLANGEIEYKNRRTGEKQMIAKDQLLDFLKGQIKA